MARHEADPQGARQQLAAWMLAGVLRGAPTPILLHAKHSGLRRDEDVALLTVIADDVRALLQTLVDASTPEAVVQAVLDGHRVSQRACAVAVTLAVLPDVVPLSHSTPLGRLWETAMQACLTTTAGFFSAAAVWLRVKSSGMPAGEAVARLRRRCEQAPDSTLTVELKTDLGFAGLTLRFLLRTYLYQSGHHRTTAHRATSPWMQETMRALRTPISRLAHSADAERRNSLLRLAIAQPLIIGLLADEQLPTGTWTAATADVMRQRGVYERLIAKAPMGLRMEIATILGGYADLREPILQVMRATLPVPSSPMYPETAAMLRDALHQHHGHDPARATWCRHVLTIFDAWRATAGALGVSPATVVRYCPATQTTDTPLMQSATLIRVPALGRQTRPAPASERRRHMAVMFGGRRASDIVGGLRSESARAKGGAWELQQVLLWAALAQAA